MADNFQANRGLESKIKQQAVNSGSLWLSEDGQNLYLDSKDGTKRIHITDVIDLSVESPTTYYPNKIYIDGDTLKRFNKTTNKLEVISNLGNDFIWAQGKEFTFSDDNLRANISDSSSPKNGTIVIDKNGNSGIVIASNSNTLTLLVINNTTAKNKLINTDIYFDSNYTGKQVGTFDCPFNDAKKLYDACNNIGSRAIVFLKGNSTIDFSNISNFTLKNEILFKANREAIVDNIGVSNRIIFPAEVNLKANVLFSNVCISAIDVRTVPTFKSNSFRVVFITSNTIGDIIFDKCLVNLFNKSDINGTITLQNDSYFYSNHSITSTVNITNNKNQDDEYGIGSIILNYSSVGTLSVKYANSVSLTGTNVNTLKLENIRTINLVSGQYNGNSNISILNCGSLYLNQFDYKGHIDFSKVILYDGFYSGNEKQGLSTKQIYDDNFNRKYGSPNNTSLEAHLDKIGDSIGQLNDAVLNVGDVSKAFITKNTFTEQEELTGTFREGDVMTYVNEMSQNLEFTHDLTLVSHTIQDEYDYDSFNYLGEVNMFFDLPSDVKKDDTYNVKYDEDNTNLNVLYTYDGNGKWYATEKSTKDYYKFTLDNASYFIKYANDVNIFNVKSMATDIKKGWELDVNSDFYITIPVQSVNGNEITASEFRSKTVKQISNIMDEIDSEKTLTTSQRNQLYSAIESTAMTIDRDGTFIQTIKISYKDRLIKLSNGWDKLSGSTDSDSGNYHIVSTYNALSNIENDATRTVGTLAYVQDEDKVYKWAIVDEATKQKDWVEFSSGSGGSGSIITEMQYCDPNDTENDLHQFNGQKIKYPTIYYNNEDSIILTCYVNTAQSGPITATVTCKPTSGTINEFVVLTQQLVKRTNYIEIPKDKIYDGSAYYYIAIQDMYGYSFYITDADGNSIVNKLTYMISTGSFKLSTTFDDSIVYASSSIINFPYSLTLSDNYSCRNLGIDVYDKDRTTKLTRLPIADNNTISGDKSGTYSIETDKVVDDKGQIILVNGEYTLVLNADILNTLTNEEIHPEVVKDLILMEPNTIKINDLELLNTENYINSFSTISYEFITTCPESLYNIYYKFSTTEITDASDIDSWNVIKNVQPLSNRTIINNTIQTPEVAGNYYLAIVCKLESGYMSNISNNVSVDIINLSTLNCMPLTDACVMCFDTQYNVGTEDTWQSKYITETGSVNTRHKMKIYDTINVQGANGWNNKEVSDTTSENYDLEPGNILSDNDYNYLKLFGDTYGMIMNTDDSYNISSEYSAFSDVNTQGFTVECLFRANYPGNLNTTVLKIDGTNGIEIKPDSIKAWFNGANSNVLERSIIENSWTHVVFTVNPIVDTDNSDYTKQVPIKHAAIYLNGVLSKACAITDDTILTNAPSEGRIIFNKNDDVYGKTDIKVFRIYSKGFNSNEVLNNYHACIKDLDKRQEEVNKNNIATSNALTEIYFIRNANGTANKKGILNVDYENLNKISSKAASKTNMVNSTVVIRSYNGNVYTDAIYKNVDVALQGTSTLAYPHKNYKIRFYDETRKADGYGKKLNISFTNPVDDITWKPEYVYTMKCDYMESSHMNNTGIARFINNEIYECGTIDTANPYNEDITSGKRLTHIQRKYASSPHYNGYRTLIDGFPVMLFESDNASITIDENGKAQLDKNQFDVMGTFMFNLDKSANDNLGFIEEDDTGDLINPYVQSIEVSTNSATAAGAFNSWNGSNIDNDTNMAFANQVDFYNKSLESRYHYEEDDSNGDYVAIDKANNEICLGQKYTLDGDKYTPISDKNAELYTGTLYRPLYNEDNICYNTFARFINFVDNASDNVFKNYINKHLNLSFAIDYYIITMIFGMVDNFGKNMMITSWNTDENGNNVDPKYIDPTYRANDYVADSTGSITANKIVQWYPTFYDMDTCNGLDNNGEETIQVNAEMPLDKLSGYIYQSTWDPAKNHSLYVAKPIMYNETDDKNYPVDDRDATIFDEEYDLIRSYVVNSNIAANTAYPNYYMYPRDLIKMLALLTLNTSSQNVTQEMLAAKEHVETEIKTNAIYSYYWTVDIETKDAEGKVVTSVTIGNDTFDKTKWLEFNCSTSMVSMSTDESKRFRFYNTSNSRLWSRLAILFQKEIYNRYHKLRLDGVLDPDNIISFLEDFTSGKIPKAYYNINAIFKYLSIGTELFKSFSRMCNGDRRLTLKKWLNERFLFIDTVLYDPSSKLPTTASDMYKYIDNKPSVQNKTELILKTYSPCYITIARDMGANQQRKYVSSDIKTYRVKGQITETIDGQLYEIGTEQNSAIYIYGIKNISTIDSLKNLLLQNGVELGGANKLLSVDLAYNTNITAIKAVEGNEYYFTSLNLSNCTGIKELDLSKMKYLEDLNLSGCTKLTTLTLPKNGRLKSLNLKGCNMLEELILNNLFQLESYNITGCSKLKTMRFLGCQKIKTLNLNDTSTSKLYVENCNNLTSLTLSGKTINEIVINGCKKLQKLDLSSNTFSNYTLQLGAMTALTSLNVSSSSGITRIVLPNVYDDGTAWGDKFTNLNITSCSSLQEIGYLGNKSVPGTLDFTRCTNLTSLSTFNSTKGTTIKSLTYTKCGFEQFARCSLQTLTSCTLSGSGNISGMFRNTYLRSISSDTTFKFPNATDAEFTFYDITGLTKAVVSKLINKDNVPKLKNLNRMFDNAEFAIGDRELDTQWFKDLYITSYNETFAYTNITSITKDALACQTTKDNSGTITPVTCTKVFWNCTSLTSVPLTLITSLPKVTNTTGMFANCIKLTNAPSLYDTTNIVPNTDLQYTVAMFHNCPALKVTLNYHVADIQTIEQNIDSSVKITPIVPSGNDSGYMNFTYISTYYLPNLKKCISMYSGCSLFTAKNVKEGDLETGKEISAIPEYFFNNNTELTDISDLFYNCKNIKCKLPDHLFTKDGHTCNIKYAAGVFASTGIIGTLKSELFKGAENITHLSNMSFNTSKITDLGQLYNASLTSTAINANVYTSGDGQKLGYGDSKNQWLPTCRSIFFGTSISDYEDTFLSPLTKLQNVGGLFANRLTASDHSGSSDQTFQGSVYVTSTKDSDSRCCISPLTFASNINLTNACAAFAFQGGLGGVPSSDLFIKNTQLTDVSGLFYQCYNLGSGTGMSVTGTTPAKMINFSKSPIQNYAALFSDCSKFVVSLYSDANINYYPMRDTFSTNKLYLSNIAYMFNLCPALIRFEDDYLFNEKAKNMMYAQYAFNQAYTFTSSETTIINDETDTTYPYFGLKESWINNASGTNPCYYTSRSTITGKIPKYLFKNHHINLSYIHKMFAGTAITGVIPSTIFDIDANYVEKEVTKEYYYVYVPTDTDMSDNTFYYKNNDGEMVVYDSTAGDVQKYLKGSITYTDKEVKNSVLLVHFSKLKSVSCMFAYCSHLGHTPNGLSTDSYKDAPLYDDIAFDGYVKDDNGDYVLSDDDFKFRLYNPNTDDYNGQYLSDFDITADGNKQRYRENNSCQLSPNAYTYNSIIKTFSTNLNNIYFLHPNTFQFFSTESTISMSAFVKGCINLQGVIHENMFNNAMNISSLAEFFMNCIHLYGTTSGELNNLLDYQLQYLQSTARMFYNCISLGRLSSVPCKFGDIEINANGFYTKGFISNRKQNSLGIFYPGQNTLSNIAYMFFNCVYLTGTVQYRQFINTSKQKALFDTSTNYGVFTNYLSEHDDLRMTKSGFPSSSYLIRLQ